MATPTDMQCSSARRRRECDAHIYIRRPLLVKGQQAVRPLRGGEPSFILPIADPGARITYAGGVLHFYFLARAAWMLQTASGDDPKIKQNSNTSKIASGRPRIAPRRLQDSQEAQTDHNRTPKRTPNKPPNRRHIKVKCDMMIVQKILKSLCKTHIIDMQNIVCSSLSAS